MVNYVDYDKIMDIINDPSLFKSYNEYLSVFDAIDNLPTTGVVLIIHAEWVYEYNFDGVSYYCSNCGEEALTKKETTNDYVCTKFCPNCGAKMNKD